MNTFNAITFFSQKAVNDDVGMNTWLFSSTQSICNQPSSTSFKHDVEENVQWLKTGTVPTEQTPSGQVVEGGSIDDDVC